jgi:hypothetical protein
LICLDFQLGIRLHLPDPLLSFNLPGCREFQLAIPLCSKANMSRDEDILCYCSQMVHQFLQAQGGVCFLIHHDLSHWLKWLREGYTKSRLLTFEHLPLQLKKYVVEITCRKYNIFINSEMCPYL